MSKRSVNRRWAVLTSVLVVVLALVALPILFSQGGAGPTTTASPEENIRVEDLTGKDVGLALGLGPIEPKPGDVITGCAAYVEYDGENGGFCIADATKDPIEQVILSYQVKGYERTEALEAYAEAVVDFRNRDIEGGTAESAQAMQNVLELLDRVLAQGKVSD